MNDMESAKERSADRFETIKARQYRTESYMADDIPWLIVEVEHLRRLVPADGKLTPIEEAQAASIRHWQQAAENLQVERDKWRELALNIVRCARDNRGHLPERAYPASVYEAMIAVANEGEDANEAGI